MRISRAMAVAALLLTLAANSGCDGNPPGPRPQPPPDPTDAWSLRILENDRFLKAGPGYSWSFPADHWAHRNYRNEWWYFTGQLVAPGEPEREFGFQFTLFRIALRTDLPDMDSSWSSRGLLMGHASVVDKTNGEHVFSEILHRETPLYGKFAEPGDSPIAWSAGPAGTERPWTLDWDVDGFDFSMQDRVQQVGFQLRATPSKSLVFQGPNGFSPKDGSGRSGSMYYSYSRLKLAGTLELTGSSFNVTGLGWMDKEFSSNHLAEQQVGWDWFSLQLDSGADLMLFRLRREDGSQDFASGTLIDIQGRPTYLEADEIQLSPGRVWTSPRTGRGYPVEWIVQIPSRSIRLHLRPAVDGQENVSRARGGIAYWEGAIDAYSPAGQKQGVGYLELTGYGSNNRPPI